MNGDGWYPAELDGPEWVRPAEPDCPDCPCHTLRVCVGKVWHLAWPRHEGCPCEKAAVAADTPPATRQVTVTVGGVTRTVTAQAPTVGFGAGLLLTPRVFLAADDTGGPVTVAMVLTAATDRTPADQVALCEMGRRWAIRLTASHGGAQVRISGWHDA
ncbi:hypothetical protein [Kitasatospora sp. NPDC056184]|uniref:hypothetical protein n=1 Tax=Kitasatospora sp. NPDC056184 TaxID=3345738 RepID=UPI0035D61877